MSWNSRVEVPRRGSEGLEHTWVEYRRGFEYCRGGSNTAEGVEYSVQRGWSTAEHPAPTVHLFPTGLVHLVRIIAFESFYCKKITWFSSEKTNNGSNWHHFLCIHDDALADGLRLRTEETTNKFTKFPTRILAYHH